MSGISSDEKAIAQYHECCEDLRQYGTLIWQGASLGISVTSGLVIASHQFLREGFVRTGLVAIAFWYALASAFILAKYRHYSEIRAQTATLIEDTLETKRIQRFTNPEENEEDKYWYPRKAIPVLQPRRTHWILIFSMFFAAGIVLAILFVNLRFLTLCP